jgi:hypothetical protein
MGQTGITCCLKACAFNEFSILLVLCLSFPLLFPSNSFFIFWPCLEVESEACAYKHRAGFHALLASVQVVLLLSMNFFS